MKHKTNISAKEALAWIIENDLTVFKTDTRFSELVKRGVITYRGLGKGGRKRYDTTSILIDLRNGELLKESVDKTTALKDLPPPRDNQTQEDYQQTIAASLGADPTINEANIFYTIYRGKLAQQKFDIEAEKLIYRTEVEDVAFSTAKVIRDQLLTLPERLAAEVATMTDAVEIREVLYAEIIKTLTIISTGTPFAR